MWRLLLLALLATAEDTTETDGEGSRKILGSSVVTSVSVIMESSNGSKVYTDAVGKPVAKPITASDLASPIDFLHPDRYEFYTFDDSGELVKRLMTLEEIQEIIATGAGDGFTLDSFTSNGFIPEKRVNDVVNNVQNVVKDEMKVHQEKPEKPDFDTPDVSDSWSMILPAVFGNSGEDFKPEKPIAHITAETIMIEPTTGKPIEVSSTQEQISTTQKIATLISRKTPPTVSTTTTEQPPRINVEITTNSNSTTEKPPSSSLGDGTSPFVQILSELELGKDNRPILYVTKKTTKKPFRTTIVRRRPTTISTRPPTTFSTKPSTTVVTGPTTTFSANSPTTLATKSVTSRTTIATRPILTTTDRITTDPAERDQTFAPSSLVTSQTSPPQIQTSIYPWTQQTLAALLNKVVSPEEASTVKVVILQSSPSSTFSTFPITAQQTSTTTAQQASTTEPATTTAAQASLVTTAQTETTAQSTSTTTPRPITEAAPATSVVTHKIAQESMTQSTGKLTESTTSATEVPATVPEAAKRTTVTAVVTSSETELPTTSEVTEPELVMSTSWLRPSTTPKAQALETGAPEDSTAAAAAATAADVAEIEEVEELQTSSSSSRPLVTAAQTTEHTSATSSTQTSPTEGSTNAKTTEVASTQRLVVTRTVPTTEAPITIQTTATPEAESQTQVAKEPIYIPLKTIDASELQKISSSVQQDSSFTSTVPDETSTQFAQTSPTATTSEADSSAGITVTTAKSTTEYDRSSTEQGETERLPTLLELLHTYHSLQPDTFVATPEKPVETSTVPDITSTYGSLTTFFEVSGNNKVAQSTTTTTTEDTRTTDGGDDLSTLSSEYVRPNKIPSTTLTNAAATTSTTVSASSTTDLSNEIATPPPEFLEQFLLTSTNIYEINSELADRIGLSTTIQDPEPSTTISSSTAASSTTEEDLKSTQDDARTTEGDIRTTEAQTEKFWIRVKETTTDAPTSTTTDENFIASIEQLISQAMGVTVDPPTVADVSGWKIEEMINGTAKKPMPQLRIETATVASSLADPSTDSTTSVTEEPTTPTAEEQTTAVPTTASPHIINITIIRNSNDSDSYTTEATTTGSTQQFLTDDASKDSSTENLRFEESGYVATTERAEEVTTEKTSVTTVTVGYTSTEATTEQASDEVKKNESSWTLVSTVSPLHSDVKEEETEQIPSSTVSPIPDPPAPVELVPRPMEGFGLDDSTSRLDPDIQHFVNLCNELAFGFWRSVTTGISTARSVVISPFAATSVLAMVFLGARGATSGEMNEILKLDDMVTFNPHLIFKNVSESIKVGPETGVATSAIVRELFSDRSKGKLLGFYKERVRQFYDGHVEEASFREIGDVIRRRTNLLVKKQTGGKIQEFLRDGSVYAKPPLAGISASIFQTDCSGASSEGRDGELHFVVVPSIRQRRLVPIPAAVWRSDFLAGYEPSLDATAAALGTKDKTISTIFVIPGQQGVAAPGDGLNRLEKRLVESAFKSGAWGRLLRSLIPRPGLELQIPRFSHRSLINATVSLQTMGLRDLFDSHKADLRGLNGNNHELHLSDVLQINEFANCGEERIGEPQHKEFYPATAARRARQLEGDAEEPRDYQRAFHDPLHDPSYLSLPLPLRPRQARLPEVPRLRFDRPFLFFVRHNPSGLILHMGRFHPRLLP